MLSFIHVENDVIRSDTFTSTSSRVAGGEGVTVCEP